MKNFLQEYAGRGLAMIAMGNEPHGTGQKVLDNVRAYKAIYETVKAFDPKIHVIGTSVEPNEEYFQAGYQNYLDSYDFHIYEHYTNVRRTIREYRALMNKYNAVKPIHSTELGLNSQGQTRQAVAVEMIKKCHRLLRRRRLDRQLVHDPVPGPGRQSPRPVRRRALRLRLQVQPVQSTAGRHHLLPCPGQRDLRQEVRRGTAISQRRAGVPVPGCVGRLPASAVVGRRA
jgi:hypothetical protein